MYPSSLYYCKSYSFNYMTSLRAYISHIFFVFHRELVTYYLCIKTVPWTVMGLTLTWTEWRMFWYIKSFLHWQKTQRSGLFTISVSWRYYLTLDSVFMFAILLSARCFLISGAKPSISLSPVMKNQVFGLSALNGDGNNMIEKCLFWSEQRFA